MLVKSTKNKYGKKYSVTFSHRNQQFILYDDCSQEEAKWFARILRKCFKNYKEDILNNN